MAEIIPFPSQLTLDYLEGQIGIGLEADELDIAKIDSLVGQFLQIAKEPLPRSVYAYVQIIISLDSAKEIAEQAPNILGLIKLVYEDKHPTNYKLRNSIAKALPKEEEVADPEVDNQNLPPRELIELLDKIHLRELPSLDYYENEYPRTTFLKLYKDLDQARFYRVFIAYCDTYGVDWSSLVQYIPWLNQ